MQNKNIPPPRRVRTFADIEAAQKSLAESTELLRARNDRMQAYLEDEPDDPVTRVANSPDVGLEDVTERARKYWDKLEGRRSSVPPEPTARPVQKTHS